MKRNFKLTILTGLLIITTFYQSFGQGASLNGFSVKASPGALTYSGELSTNNWNLPNRIYEGSKFGISAGIIKQFAPWLGVQVQMLTGSLYSSSKAMNIYFSGTVTEFSLSARFDPLRLISSKTVKFSPYLSVGIGTFGFRSVERQTGTNQVLGSYGYGNDGITKRTKESGLSLPVALGLSYSILPGFQIELEHALRITNSDIIDSYSESKSPNDLFSLTSLGFRYTIPIKSADKAGNTKPKNALPLEKTVKPSQVKEPDFREANIFVECDMPEYLQVGQVFDIHLRVNKGKYRGTAKLIQKYPEGFLVPDDSTKIDAYQFINQNAIFEWKQIPADSIVSCNYRMKAGENLQGNHTITGKLEYQEAGVTKSVRFNKTIFIDSNKLKEAKEEPVNQLIKQEEARDPAGKVPASKTIIKPYEPLTGIEFRVQCGAFRDKGQADIHLASKYGITETIREEYIDGWYKYTVGSFRTYEEAVKYRDRFIAVTRILSAFIVAYKDGQRLVRITDALK